MNAASKAKVAGFRAGAFVAGVYADVRFWLARGRVKSSYWCPRVGDRVKVHDAGAWLVYGLSIREREVTLVGDRTEKFECIDPADPPAELLCECESPDWYSHGVHKDKGRLCRTCRGREGVERWAEHCMDVLRRHTEKMRAATEAAPEDES